MAGYIGGILTDVYGVAQRADGLDLDPVLLVGALAMGIVTSLFAAVIPARAAASVDPVKALQKGRNQALGEGESRLRRWAAFACAAASAIALLFSRNTVIFYAGFLLTGLTAVLLAPSLTLWLSHILRARTRMGPPRRRNASRRQPDPRPPPHLRHRSRTHAVAGAGDRRWVASPAPATIRSPTGCASPSTPTSS